MKKLILSLTIFCSVLISCNSVKTSSSKMTSLEGFWELNYISGPRIAFEGLYPNDKPTIAFDLKESRVFGKNSCNSYFGPLAVDGNKINFKGPMGATKMFCPGEGENVYMTTLERIDSYSVSKDGKVLTLMMDDIAMMRFEKK
ncbi:META domain-containing protein [Flavobacterium degerlachei]|jgi:heat shock protein HslJ|uniref:Heat shock protein HslJ n=1 Tax=Flavobacterium degerlachei TaxID=229203 RepID=A0A1H2SII8_9FLAO|nr:META domain-containing protein [Flavobacterium degerlachei]SDW31265.1 Heat shock protein HslJ [Flavobacterium degerlachei]